MGRGDNEEVAFIGFRVPVGEDRKFSRWMMVTVAQQCECT
jgi:hypothetical protein